MSILIKGMEMPKETYAHCMIVKDIDGSAQLHVCTKNSEDISEWEYYDLVPVPPHGDLIDRYELERDIERYVGGEESRSRFHHWVQVQNAVILGDKGEET